MISSMTSSASFSERSARSASLVIASLIMGLGWGRWAIGYRQWGRCVVSTYFLSPIAHCLAPILQFEKIAEQVLAGCRENGFGMELHPLHAERSMPEAHDLAFNGLG